MNQIYQVSAIFIWLILPSNSWADPIQTIALTGSQAPGISDGNFFTNLSLPIIDADGRVTFYGFTEQFVSGFWSGTTGEIQPNILSNDDLADIFGEGIPTGFSFSRPPLRSGDLTVFFASARTSDAPSVVEFGAVIQDATKRTFTTFARSDTALPGIPEEYRFDYIVRQSMSPQGTIAVTASVKRDPLMYYDDFRGGGLWLLEGGEVNLITFGDMQVPGIEEEATFANLDQVMFGSGSSYVFRANLRGDMIVGPSGSLWSNRSGQLEAVVQANQQAPGTPTGTSFGHFVSNYAMNRSNQIAFQTELISDDSEYSDKTAIWSEASGELKMVAMRGQQAPGVEAGTVFHFFDETRIVFNDAGHIAFLSGLFRSDDEPRHPDWTTIGRGGLWADRNNGSGLELVVRAGQPAPGMEEEYIMGASESLDINSAGQIVFHGLANCRVDYIDCVSKEGIWAEDRDGELQLIAMQGQSLEVAPGDFREIAELTSALQESWPDSLRRAINDDGQITFSAEFTDGSTGIFVSSAVAIPEPTTASMLICCLLSAVLPHRYRPVRS